MRGLQRTSCLNAGSTTGMHRDACPTVLLRTSSFPTLLTKLDPRRSPDPTTSASANGLNVPKPDVVFFKLPSLSLSIFLGLNLLSRFTYRITFQPCYRMTFQPCCLSPRKTPFGFPPSPPPPPARAKSLDRLVTGRGASEETSACRPNLSGDPEL